MAKSKKGSEGTIVVVNFAQAGHEVSRTKTLNYGELLEVNVPANRDASLKEAVEAVGLRLLSQSTHLSNGDHGAPMRRHRLSPEPGERKDRLFRVSYVAADRKKPPVFTATVHVQGPA